LWKFLKFVGYGLIEGERYLVSQAGIKRIAGKFRLGQNYLEEFHEGDWILANVQLV
jgi:hypothetical protein